MFLKRKLFFKNGNIFKYAKTSWQTRGKPLPLTAGPESLEDYFQKDTFGSKSGTKSLIRRYQAKFAQTVSEH